jgi:hypothetical protein
MWFAQPDTKRESIQHSWKRQKQRTVIEGISPNARGGTATVQLAVGFIQFD